MIRVLAFDSITIDIHRGECSLMTEIGQRSFVGENAKEAQRCTHSWCTSSGGRTEKHLHLTHVSNS